MVKTYGIQLNSEKGVKIVINPEEKLIQVKSSLYQLAKHLDIPAFLRYKKDIAQCSDTDRLQDIAISLVKEVICLL